MRLADFILNNIERILAEWDAFARSTSPGATMEPLALRDHAEEILRATALDMTSAQTAAQQSDKSKGHDGGGADSLRVNGASELHATGRVEWGFDLVAMVSEYRALRASVIRLWSESTREPDQRDLADLTRFNESIDQSLAGAVRGYTQRVDRSRHMFLAILGHDLRNPLNSMMMSAEWLTRSAEGREGGNGDGDRDRDRDGAAAEAALQVQSSAAAMGHMIADLLDFTGAALGGEIPLSPAPMDLRDLCNEVTDEMRAAHPSCVLHFDADGDLTGDWDASRLRQVVSNLLGNAIQHGAADGTVRLAVRGTSPDEVVLSVHNDGPPIPPQLLSTIFDPLVHGTSRELRKQRRPGSIGLGLYIAREIATAHGGSIDVRSTEQTGTDFSVRLPRRPPGPRDPRRSRGRALR
jgi:signal transduction histidine kinase